MSWTIISQPPLIATSNQCGEKCVAKACEDETQLVNRYIIFPTTMGQTTLKGLVMAKKQATPKTCVIQSGM